MTADIVFSLMLSQLSDTIPHTKRINFEKLVDCDEFFRDQHHRRHHQHIGTLLGIKQYTSKRCWRKKVIELENYLGLRGESARLAAVKVHFMGGYYFYFILIFVNIMHFYLFRNKYS